MTQCRPLIACFAAVTFLEHPNTPWIIGALVLALLSGAIVIAWADRWRRANEAEESPATLLGSFRAMYDRGELSEEEYRKVLTRLAPQLRGDAPPRPRPRPPTPHPPADPAD